MKAHERFLQYVKFNTASDERSGLTPSTEGQRDFARFLCDELKRIGVTNAYVDENAYVMGSIPADEGYEELPSLGFIAHMDTSPDFSGEDVRPRIFKNYNGGDIEIRSGESVRLLSTKEFPHLASLKGRTLITADGNTLLGADDKAGIAEIMTVAERVIEEKIPSGKLCFCFTPDEEIGEGANHFDIASFGADYAYTVDGGAEGEIEYENFNAYSAVFKIAGRNIHPGDAKGMMINASLVSTEIVSMLPSAETPALTEGYEGFYHLCSINGSVESAKLEYIVRDHGESAMNARLATLRLIEKTLNEKYGCGTVSLALKEQYRNMKEIIDKNPFLIDIARESIEEEGIDPISEPVRGGTDGARLSFMGLPCPNLGTGGYAYHGPYEHITVEGMDKATNIIIGIIRRQGKLPDKRRINN